MEYITLDRLNEGESLCVTKIFAKGITRRRLNDLGITKGTNIKNIFSPPWNDPTAYALKGAVIALRCETSSQISGFKITEDGA